MQFLLACGFEDKVISVEGAFKKRWFSVKLVCDSESGIRFSFLFFSAIESQSVLFFAELTDICFAYYEKLAFLNLFSFLLF